MKPHTRWLLVAAYIVVACATSATVLWTGKRIYARIGDDANSWFVLFLAAVFIAVFYAQLMGVGAAYYKIKEWAASRGL